MSNSVTIRPIVAYHEELFISKMLKERCLALSNAMQDLQEEIEELKQKLEEVKNGD